jgi:hypothetical protein
MVDERGHFFQVAARSTRKAWRVNRIKPPGTAGGSPQLRFAVRVETRASIRPKRHPRTKVGRPRRYAALLLRTATSALAQAQNFCQRFPHGRGPAWVGFDTFFPCLTVFYC